LDGSVDIAVLNYRGVASPFYLGLNVACGTVVVL
jgi:hypothetical protein